MLNAKNLKTTCAMIFFKYVEDVAPLQPATVAVPKASYCVGHVAALRKLRKNRGNSQMGLRCLLSCCRKTTNSEGYYVHEPGRNTEMEQQTPESNAMQLIGKRELSLRLSCSIRHIERLVARGELPLPLKVGSCSRFSLADVHRYIESLKHQREMRPTQSQL